MKNEHLFYVWLVIAFTLDQASKRIVASWLKLGEKAGIASWFDLHHVTNTGIAFSFLQNLSSVILIIATVIVLGLFYYRKEFFHTKTTSAGFGLIVGGALGNIVDRILYGKVTDFIAFSFWPTFNLADTAITIGAGLLILHYWKHNK